MLISIDVKIIFNCLFIGKFRRYRVVEDCKYSPNSGCRPSSCLLAVFAMFLANSSPFPSSEMFPHFVLTTKTTQPRPRVFSVNCSVSSNYAAQLTLFFTYRKILSNLINSSWL